MHRALDRLEAAGERQQLMYGLESARALGKEIACALAEKLVAANVQTATLKERTRRRTRTDRAEKAARRPNADADSESGGETRAPWVASLPAFAGSVLSAPTAFRRPALELLSEGEFQWGSYAVAGYLEDSDGEIAAAPSEGEMPVSEGEL